MIRYFLLTLLIVFAAAYSWKDWFRGLCVIVLLMAVLERPDMPKHMLGVPGLNPFNFLLINVVLAWLVAKKEQTEKVEFPKGLKGLLVAYVILSLISFLRLVFDRQGLADGLPLGQPVISQAEIWTDYFINNIKWVIPGLLVYKGCDTEEKARLLIYCILASLFLLSILVIRNISVVNVLKGYSLTKYALKLGRRVGYHRVELSMLLGGAFWAIWACISTFKNKRVKLSMAAGSFVVLFAQSLTGGRGGYLGWLFAGLYLGIAKWRKLLIIIPVAMVLAVTFVPPVRQRVLHGLNIEDREVVYSDEAKIDADALSAGRLELWPFVIQKIFKRPLFGYGRLGFIRSGASIEYGDEYGEYLGHPHSAYLELLLDMGIVGGLVVGLIFFKIVKRATSLLRDSDRTTNVLVGGVTLALVLSFLVAALTAQTFYPREGSVWMYCAIFLMLRAYRDFKARQTVRQRV